MSQKLSVTSFKLIEALSEFDDFIKSYNEKSKEFENLLLIYMTKMNILFT